MPAVELEVRDTNDELPNGLRELDSDPDMVDDESEEGDPVDDDDSDEGAPVEPPARPAARRPPARPPARPPPPPRTADTVVREQQDDELAEIYGNLNLGEGQHSVRLERLEPREHPDTGEPIGGYCMEVQRAITLEEIRKKYGGGKFKITISGPRANGRGRVNKGGKTFHIAGPPKSLTPPSEQKRVRDDDIVEKIIESSAAREERIERQLHELHKESRAKDKDMIQLVAALSKKEDTLAPLLTMMREESNRRAQEFKEEMRRKEDQDRKDREERERREREERAASERRAKEEREERERRDAERARQHEKDLAFQRESLQLQMKQMEMAVAASSNQMNLFVQMMQKSDADKAATSQQLIQAQMQHTNQIVALSQQANDTTVKLLMEQVKNKPTFDQEIDKLLKFKDLLEPPQEDVPPWKQVLEEVKEVAGNVIPSFAALQAAQAAKAQAQPPRVAPRSVAVVEGVDVIETEHALPPPSEAPAAEEDDAMKNDLTDFTAYPDGAPDALTLTLLAKNLDLAIQRELSIEEMYEKCVAPLPEQKREFIKGAPLSLITGFIAAQVPPTWVLRSLAAEEKLDALYKLIQEK